MKGEHSKYGLSFNTQVIISSSPRQIFGKLKGINLPGGVMWQKPLWKLLSKAWTATLLMSLQSGQSDSLIWWLNRLISTPCVFLPLHGHTSGKWGHRDNTSFLSAAKLVQCLCLGKERMLCFGTGICFLSFRLHYPVSVDNAGPQWSNCAASPREKWSALSTTPVSHLEAGKRAQKHQCLRPQPSYPSLKREDP